MASGRGTRLTKHCLQRCSPSATHGATCRWPISISCGQDTTGVSGQARHWESLGNRQDGHVRFAVSMVTCAHQVEILRTTVRAACGCKRQPTTRHYGLIANARRRENLARARELLNLPPDTDDATSIGDGVAEPGQPTYVCPDCGAPMIIIETLIRGQPIRAPLQQRGAA